MLLPLLEKLYSHVRGQAGLLQDWHCIYVQHILCSNIECVEFLVRMGIRKENIAIFGKAYSTSQDALKQYGVLGYTAINTGVGYDYSEPFDDAICRAVTSKIFAFLEGGAKQLLIVDEGGIAIRAVSVVGPTKFSKLSVVELTARGAQQYHLLSSISPIIDVARSQVKKDVEPPIIAQSMIASLAGETKRVFDIELDALRVGIIGAGAIGAAVISELKQRGAKVCWFDEDPEKTDRTAIDDVIIDSDLILSSTGRGADWISALISKSPRLILANCGSSDVEFQLWKVLSLALERGFKFWREVLAEPWRGNIRIERAENILHVLKGGFPINFDGSSDPIHPSKIQITRAILMAGAIQAALSSSPGVHELDWAVQQMLKREYATLLH